MRRAQAVRSSKMDSYEHVLMCLICRSLFDDHDHQPKFLPCHHTFCKDCLREFVRQIGDEIECPSCRKPTTIPAAGVAALQTNFYAKYIQSLVYGLGVIGSSAGDAGGGVVEPSCQVHESKKAEYFCKQCSTSGCELCFEEGGACTGHQRQPLAAATEDFQSKIDASFARANALIEQKKVELEARLKAFSEEKDKALLRIESAFETHSHLLNRRATLLKNKVIDSYNERVISFESDLEEISTAMTCIVSLKEFHETAVSRGQLDDVEKGVEELNEVYSNVESRIRPMPYHVVFEERHGVERFKSCIKDLGKVTCFAGSASLNQKNLPTTSGDDDPPDTTPSSPHPPSSGDFPRPSNDDGGTGRCGSNRGNSEDNEGERPRPEGERNGSASESCCTLADGLELSCSESGRGQQSDNAKHLTQENGNKDETTQSTTSTASFDDNTNNGISNFLTKRLDRPFSARVRKAFEKGKDEEEENPDVSNSVVRNNNNCVIRNLASPVRRPKFLISPEEFKDGLTNRNKVNEIVSTRAK